MKRSCKVAILALFILGIQLCTWPQVQSEGGTTVVFDVAQDKVIVAADSRERSMDDGTYRDNGCKITALNSKVVFAAAGYRNFNGSFGNGPIVSWDSHDVAMQAFKAVLPKPVGNQDDIVPALAHEWERISKEFFLRIGPDIFNLIPEEEKSIAEGLFVGVSRTGHITTIQSSVRLNRSVPSIETQSQVIMPGKFGAMGHNSVVFEFYNRSSPRAVAEINRWGNTVVGKDRTEQKILFMTQLVKWSILYEPRGVGGDVDTVLLDSSGVHWIHRKENCKENEGYPHPN